MDLLYAIAVQMTQFTLEIHRDILCIQNIKVEMKAEIWGKRRGRRREEADERSMSSALSSESY